jgi:hypothetical protein
MNFFAHKFFHVYVTILPIKLTVFSVFFDFIFQLLYSHEGVFLRKKTQREITQPIGQQKTSFRICYIKVEIVTENVV